MPKELAGQEATASLWRAFAQVGKMDSFFPRIGSREEPSSGDRGEAGGSGVTVRKASLKALSVFKGVDMVGVRVGGT